MKTVVAYTWYAAGTAHLCLVIIRNEKGEFKSYINVVAGNDPESDVIYTYEWGAKFPISAGIEAIQKTALSVIRDKEQWEILLDFIKANS